MNVTVFSTQPFECDFLHQANADRHHLQLLEAGLCANTAPLAQGLRAVSVFTADQVSGPEAGPVARQDLRPPAHLPQRGGHGPPGLPYPGGVSRHRQGRRGQL